VINAAMGKKKAASKFAVPQTTLERYVKKERENPGGSVSEEMGRLSAISTKIRERYWSSNC
jgi:hypothetical protein